MEPELIRSIVWLILLVVVVGYVAYVIFNTPRYQQCAGNPLISEGFFGGVAVGSGHPDCLRTLEGSSALLERFQGAFGRPDYVEFQLILSKLACLKKDLLSPSGIVEATRYQPFETAHDREPVAEVTAQCLSQTLPIRDLDIIFDTWKQRGSILLRRLCTIANMKESDVTDAEKLFGKLWADVYDIAKGRCLATRGMREAVGHEEQPYTPPALENTRAYDGYYSGWTGQV